MDKVYMASIYKKLGMATDSATIDKQSELAADVLKRVDSSRAEILVLVVFGIDVSSESLAWLSEAAADIYPGFATTGIDGDVLVLALAVLKDILKEKTKLSTKIGMSIEAASFGGKRVCTLDPTFVEFARAQILLQQTEANHISSLNETAPAEIDELLNGIEELVPQNNFSLIWQGMRSVLDELDAGQRLITEVHYGKLQELIAATRELEEQQQTQWFAISKWSKGAKLPFGKLPVGEAIARAATELAQLTKSFAGSAAAPALLYMALSETAIVHGEKLPFAVYCTASPIVWRKSWVKVDSTPERNKLLPILAALNMASQANDEEDWQARFRREVGIDPQFEISPFDFSLQLFHELLIVKSEE
jgi:hypothetical protein